MSIQFSPLPFFPQPINSSIVMGTHPDTSTFVVKVWQMPSICFKKTADKRELSLSLPLPVARAERSRTGRGGAPGHHYGGRRGWPSRQEGMRTDGRPEGAPAKHNLQTMSLKLSPEPNKPLNNYIQLLSDVFSLLSSRLYLCVNALLFLHQEKQQTFMLIFNYAHACRCRE